MFIVTSHELILNPDLCERPGAQQQAPVQFQMPCRQVRPGYRASRDHPNLVRTKAADNLDGGPGVQPHAWTVRCFQIDVTCAVEQWDPETSRHGRKRHSLFLVRGPESRLKANLKKRKHNTSNGAIAFGHLVMCFTAFASLMFLLQYPASANGSSIHDNPAILTLWLGVEIIPHIWSSLKSGTAHHVCPA